MTVINFQDSLRARIYRMADEHLQMQEAIMHLPHHEVASACGRLEQHSIEMSRLAKRLETSEHVQSVQVVQDAQAPSFILPRDAGEERGGGSEDR